MYLVTSWLNLDDNLITYHLGLDPDRSFTWAHAIRALFTPLALVLPTLKHDLHLLLTAQQEFLKIFMPELSENL